MQLQFDYFVIVFTMMLNLSLFGEFCQFYLEIGHFYEWLRKVGRYGRELRVLSE